MTKNELKQLIKQVIQESQFARANPEKFATSNYSSPSNPPEADIEGLKNSIKTEANKSDPDFEQIRNDIDRLEQLGGF